MLQRSAMFDKISVHVFLRKEKSMLELIGVIFNSATEDKSKEFLTFLVCFVNTSLNLTSEYSTDSADIYLHIYTIS